MSDTIRNSGTFTVTINGTVSSFNGDCTLSVTKVGSNATADVKNVTSGSWQALTTASLSDLRYMYFANEGTGSIIIAVDSAGAKPIATLQPNDHAIIPWSASIAAASLYANVPMYTSSSLLYYILTEA